MYKIYKEEKNYIVSLSVPVWIFWTQTYEYVCETEEQVKRLIIPFDKTYMSYEIPPNVKPKTLMDTSYWDCIQYNNRTHTGIIRKK
jgi:hypothetical protein